jgi:flap endonuclease-1
LEGLELTKDQFVDLCIMLGCDYCDSIRGVGPKTALKLIREHSDIETIIKNIDRNKFIVPETWVPNEKKEPREDETEDEESPPDVAKASDETEEELIPVYVQARKLFNEHEVLTNVELKWKPCQAEGLTKFLVDECGFNPERVKGSIEKLQKAYAANSKPQSRMDSFFTVKPNPNAAKNAAKRKAEKTSAANSKKKGKVGKQR